MSKQLCPVGSICCFLVSASRFGRCFLYYTPVIFMGGSVPEDLLESPERLGLWNEQARGPLKNTMWTSRLQHVSFTNCTRLQSFQEQLAFFFLKSVFKMEKKMWNDKVLWGCRSSLGMTWNEFSWWVMGAWTHILFSFSIQIDFHIGACLLQLIRSVCTPSAEASGRKHWLKGPIPGVMWGSGKTALVWENRQASPLSFLRNSTMRAPPPQML